MTLLRYSLNKAARFEMKTELFSFDTNSRFLLNLSSFNVWTGDSILCQNLALNRNLNENLAIYENIERKFVLLSDFENLAFYCKSYRKITILQKFFSNFILIYFFIQNSKKNLCGHLIFLHQHQYRPRERLRDTEGERL